MPARSGWSSFGQQWREIGLPAWYRVMRSLLVALLVFGALPIVIVKPHVGVLVWSWIGYMNPHRLTWGFAYDFPFAMAVGLVTIAAWLFSREPKTLPRHPLVLLLAAFAAWVSFTTLFAVYPDQAQWKWDRTIKILLFNGFVTLGLITTRQRLDALIWVIVLSLGFFAIKGAVFTLLTGGNYRLWGPPGSFLEDNNAFGLALLMAIPLVRYLQLTAKRRGVRLCLLFAIPCFLWAVLGTYSRGAVVGLGVTVVALALKSRHRMSFALIAGVALAGAVQFMPEHWHARIASIATYDEDASAQARLQSWRYALEVARDSPIVGGGFEIFRGNQTATSAGYRSAHSIYFETLAEHGYPGLVIFLALGIGAYTTAWSVARRARDHPELAWAADLAAMVQVSIAAYAIAGLFLNLATFDLYYHLVAIVVIASSLVRQQLASRAPTEMAASPAYARPSDARA
jgi:probable O-glycosylation ligase (exosortase A-associated)